MLVRERCWRGCATNALCQRQSRTLGRDGALLSELRRDREREDPRQKMSRGGARESAPFGKHLLRELRRAAHPKGIGSMNREARGPFSDDPRRVRQWNRFAEAMGGQEVEEAVAGSSVDGTPTGARTSRRAF